MTFSNLQSITSNFPTEVRNTFLKPTGLSVQYLLNVCCPSDSKTIQEVHKLHKNKDVEIFRLILRVSEVFLKHTCITNDKSSDFLTIQGQSEAVFFY